MDLVAKLIKKPVIFKRITGLTPSEFRQVVKKLTRPFRNKYIKYKKLPGRPTGIKRIENKLICLLIYYRTYTTQLFVGFLFRVDAATVCRTIKRCRTSSSTNHEDKEGTENVPTRDAHFNSGLYRTAH